MVIKALKEPIRDRKNGPKDVQHDGDMSIGDVIEIARVMRPRSMARELSGTVKEILGTCFSVGCTVNGEHPSEIQRQIDAKELEIPEK